MSDRRKWWAKFTRLEATTLKERSEGIISNRRGVSSFMLSLRSNNNGEEPVFLRRKTRHVLNLEA